MSTITFINCTAVYDNPATNPLSKPHIVTATGIDGKVIEEWLCSSYAVAETVAKDLERDNPRVTATTIRARDA